MLASINQVLDSVKINFDASSLTVLNIALAFVMFGVALEITKADFLNLVKNPKPILVGMFSQFLLLPAVTFALVFLVKPQASIALGMFMVAACPGGNISNFITQLAKGNTALSVSLTAIATLFAIVMTPLNLYFWANLYQPSAVLIQEVSINTLDMVKLVFLILGLPLLLGMLFRHYYKNLALKVSKTLKVVSIIFFILLVVLALKNNLDYFTKYVSYVFLLVVFHNILAFVTGYSLSSLFKLNLFDKKSITIETGIQNSGLGLMLIFSFFDGLGGMAILAAFWGIWHIVSGLILAKIWSRKT